MRRRDRDHDADLTDGERPRRVEQGDRADGPSDMDLGGDLLEPFGRELVPRLIGELRHVVARGRVVAHGADEHARATGGGVGDSRERLVHRRWIGCDPHERATSGHVPIVAVVRGSPAGRSRGRS